MAGVTLVIGGTRGLGYALAMCFSQHNSVVITGRNPPDMMVSGIEYYKLDLSDTESIPAFVAQLPFVDTVIIAAGYAQFGSLVNLTPVEIEEMILVGMFTPIYLLQQILLRQRVLPNYIQITSTSAWTPRPDEPVYAAVKAGMTLFAESISRDSNVGRVLVAAPSGMRTAFWNGVDNDISSFLDPVWVAAQIYEDWNDTIGSRFRHIAILRNPLRKETRASS